MYKVIKKQVNNESNYILKSGHLFRDECNV